MRIAIPLLALSLTTACELRPTSEPAPSGESEDASTDATPEIETVRAVVRAFNAHDPEALAELVSDDVLWLAVEGREIMVEAEGRAALVEGMTGYFAAFPTVRSEIEEISGMGPYVTAYETASWTDDAGSERSQSSLAVYRIEGGLVRQVWYYPAVR